MEYECAICGIEGMLVRSNNPEPLLPREQRVCSSCNSYVTATRVVLMTKAGNSASKRDFCDTLVNVLKMAYTLRGAHESLMELMMGNMEESE